MSLWHPILFRPSSNIAFSSTPLGITRTTIFNATVPCLAISAPPVMLRCLLIPSSLSALGSGPHNRAHVNLETQAQAPNSPLFHSLESRKAKTYEQKRKESKCERKTKGSRSLCVVALLFPKHSIPCLIVIVFPFCSQLNLLESPKPNRNGSDKSGFLLLVSVQLVSLLRNQIWFLINFRSFLLDYFANFLIMLMPSEFLCLAKKN